jgi:hypothetical protein
VPICPCVQLSVCVLIRVRIYDSAVLSVRNCRVRFCPDVFTPTEYAFGRPSVDCWENNGWSQAFSDVMSLKRPLEEQ